MPPAGGRFEAAAVELHREAAALGASAHPLTLGALARLLAGLNSYYSNLIEGVRTTLSDIEAALHADYAADPKRAAAQRLAAAHVRVEQAIAAELGAGHPVSVTSADFLLRVHRDLYRDIPEHERIVRFASGREALVDPGALRGERVVVGRHVPPPADSLMAMLARFDDVYRPEPLGAVQRVIAFAASHHRLAWIHPFLDGNGRVTRLMSTMYARRIGLDAAGLWSIARGFARHRDEYYARLAAADAPRAAATDGRGALSLEGLEAWCDFVVRVALDQITFMRGLLSPATLADRLRGYAAYRAAASPEVAGPVGASGSYWRAESGELLAALVLRGEMPRGEAMRYLPGRERTARSALSALLKDGALSSPSHRAPVRLAFPEHVARFVFPDLLGDAGAADG